MLNSSNKFDVIVNCLTAGRPVTPDVAYIYIQLTTSDTGVVVPNSSGNAGNPNQKVLPVLNK
jgi:hypothetical protein